MPGRRDCHTMTFRNNPSGAFGTSSPYTRGASAAAEFRGGKSLYGTTRKAGGSRKSKNPRKAL